MQWYFLTSVKQHIFTLIELFRIFEVSNLCFFCFLFFSWLAALGFSHAWYVTHKYLA